MKELQLSSLHESLGADMETFAGWKMPIKYDRIASEHMAVRENVGIFDISHMGELRISGGNSSELVQYLTSNDVSKLSVGSAHYSTALNENGGTKDDLFVYRTDDQEYMIVVNATNVEKLYNWFESHAEGEVKVDDITSDTVMLALQGPNAQEVLQKVTEHDLDEVGRFESNWIEVADIRVLVSRSGYTGEDGFEIYIFDQSRGNAEKAKRIWSELLEVGEDSGIKPCGLGARDSLRLEAGYPLYGHELTEDITPLEARIAFVVSFEAGDFIGKESLLKQKEEGISRKRIGIKMKERGVPREGYNLLQEGEKIGEVTSGGFSPVLKAGIAMGYATPGIDTGEGIGVEIRGAVKEAVLESWPFYEED